MKRKVATCLVLIGVLGISGTAFAGISLKPAAKQGVDASVRRPLTPHEIKRLQEQGKPVPPDLMTPPSPGYQPTRPSTPQRPADPQYRPQPQRPIDQPRKPDVQRPPESHSHPYRPADQTQTRPKRPSDYEQYRPSDSHSTPQRPTDDRRPPFSRDKRPPYGNEDYRQRLPERK